MIDFNKNMPTISLIIVVRNEASAIECAVNSILQQTYPKELSKYIFVDGMSTDGTRQYLKNKVHELRQQCCKAVLLDNEKKILATGWNIAINAAETDLVCRIDAHSEICSDYVEKGIEELIKIENKNKYACVGGVIEKNLASGFQSRVIASISSSRFGVGGSPFRVVTNKKRETDTAVFAIYWRQVFCDIGFFDETLKRNQDIDFHRRVAQSGLKLLTDPDMKITYKVRGSLKKFLIKGYGDGFWIVFSKSRSLRHWVPFAFFMYLLIVLCMFWMFPVILIPLAFYVLLAIFYAIKDGKKIYIKLVMPFCYMLFHCFYGFGTLVGIMYRLLKLKV